MKTYARTVMSKVGALIVIGLLLLVAAQAAVALPNRQVQLPSGVEETRGPSSTLFSYQGQLLDAAGNPLDGSVDMIFRLYFVESEGTPFWTEAHVGSQAVPVNGGLFHVLLGSLTPIATENLSGDAYLELEVGGEVLAPRELLASVAYALEAQTLPDGATTRGSLAVQGNLNIGGHDILGVRGIDAPFSILTDRPWQFEQMSSGSTTVTVLRSTVDGKHFAFTNQDGSVIARIWANNATGGWLDLNDHYILNARALQLKDWDDDTGGDNDKYRLLARDGAWQFYNGGVVVGGYPNGTWSDLADGALVVQSKVGIGREPLTTAGSLAAAGDVAVGGNLGIGDQGTISDKVDSGGAGPHMVFETDDDFVFQTDTGRLRVSLNQYGMSFNGTTWFYFNNTVVPSQDGQFDLGEGGRRWRTAYLQSASCGALIETNLQTEEEQAAGRIDRFEEGDVLCWGIDRLEHCTSANDRLVQAVADRDGRPIVLGAEVIKVLGPVRRGDILVASDVAGYAMVNNEPLPGSVVAQALEDFEGERGLIKAMIRKW